MRVVFADTGFWVALLFPGDSLHERATAIQSALRNARLVTSEMIFSEYFTFFSNKGSLFRQRCTVFYRQLQINGEAEIIPQTSRLFHNALLLFERRPDKEWSLTDCASFQIMRNLGIGEALTYDIHFRQAGFKPLLRDD